jgi:hypothetical protein
MTGVVCPLPQALTHEDARDMHRKVRKEMPGLSDAAYRREAARRMGVDYDTYLDAWKKPKASGVTPKPTPDVPNVPAGPAPNMDRAAARAYERDYAKKNGLQPGSAASRRGAADELGMSYDDFLARWKGDAPAKPKAPRPEPIPRTTPPEKVADTPKPVDAPKADAGPTVSVPGIKRRLSADGVNFDQVSVTQGPGGDVIVRVLAGGLPRGEALRVEAMTLRRLVADGFDIRPGREEYQWIISPNQDIVWSDPGKVRKLYDVDGSEVQHTLSRGVESSDAGAAIKDGGIANTFAHEFGHFVDDIVSVRSRKAYEKMLNVMAEDLQLDDASAVIFKGRVEGSWKQSPVVRQRVINAVSRYGASSREEFFAEVWAEYTRAGDNARPHIKKWGSMIQDIAEGIS